MLVPFIILAAGSIPFGIVFTVYWFRHKQRELELEANLRPQAAIEARVRALEEAVQQLVVAHQLLSAPPDREPGEASRAGKQLKESP